MPPMWVIPAFDEAEEHEPRHCNAVYAVRYPTPLADPAAMMRPYVQIEVTPDAVSAVTEESVSSLLHDTPEFVRQRDMWRDNRPVRMPCAHPLAALLGNLEAVSRQFPIPAREAGSFIRHYEAPHHYSRRPTPESAEWWHRPATRRRDAEVQVAPPPLARSGALMARDEVPEALPDVPLAATDTRLKQHDHRRPEVFISVDMETSGPVPGRFSMLSLSACVVGNDTTNSYVELRPICDGFDPGAMQIIGRPLAEFADGGLAPDRAMCQFADWIARAVEGGRPVLSPSTRR